MSFELPTGEDLADVGKPLFRDAIIPDGYYASLVLGLRKAVSKSTQHMGYIDIAPCTSYGRADSAVQDLRLSCMLMLPEWDDQAEFETALAEKFVKDNGRQPTDEELVTAAKVAKKRAWRQLASCGRALKGDDNLPEVPTRQDNVWRDKSGRVYSKEEYQMCVDARSQAALEFMQNVFAGTIKISGYYVYSLVETEEYKGKKRSRVRYFCDDLPPDASLVPAVEWNK